MQRRTTYKVFSPLQRITNDDFHYLLKYVTKPDELPAWVLNRKRLRVFQSTKGFLKPLPPEPKSILLKEPRKRASYTMDERFWRWACMAVIRQNGKGSVPNGPSTTGNPSGGGRGNNPPSGK